VHLHISLKRQKSSEGAHLRAHHVCAWEMLGARRDYLESDDMRISSTTSEMGTPAPSDLDLSMAASWSVTRICTRKDTDGCAKA